MAMPGVTLKEIRAAIVDGYDPVSLTETLKFDMDFNFAKQIPQNIDFEHQVFRLIEWAEQRGREVELIQVTARANPRNARMQQIYKKYGLAVPVLVQDGGMPKPASPSDAADSGLEALVTPYLKVVDIGLWREKLTSVEGQVCRITLNGAARGTGFLVGPDLVMTNFHVMEPMFKSPASAAGVRCQFDYKQAKDGTQLGTEVPLHATDWRVDDSPYSKAEAENAPDREPATDDELDYALIRLARPVGSLPVAEHADPQKANPRGWVQVPEKAPVFAEKMAVIIAQHPNGAPMKLAIDTRAIDKEAGLWLRPGETRVRYATNTEGGSSGSACFDFDWNLIALHHYGDPAWQAPQFNQGIPINKIRDRLQKKAIILGA
jgi:hypothetical protein